MENELLELTKQILRINPACSLSGSLALSLQGVKIKRQPNDIDIYIPPNCKFTPISDMVQTFDNNKDDYDNYEYDRIQYVYKNIKIDTFTAVGDYHSSMVPVYNDDIKMIRFDDIIKFKVKFAFDSQISAEKHRDDIIFMIENINKCPDPDLYF